MSTTRPPASDERSAGQAEASRRGAHRARTKPLVAGLPVLAGVLIVLAAAGGAWTVFGSGDTKDSSSVVGAVPADSEPTSGATVPSAASSSAAQPTEPAQSSPADATTGSTTNPASQTVDRTVSLVILNSVPVQGLARRVSTNLAPDGWTVARTDNSKQKNLSTTRVYYGSKSLKATAQALVKDLGFGSIAPDAQVAKSGLVVVLGQDAV
jgi:cytoskeletal protein RodZ